MFAFLSMLFSRFMSRQQIFEARSFEIYLAMLTEGHTCSEYQLAKNAIHCARQFDIAMADETIGLDDLTKRYSHGLPSKEN